MSSESSGGYDGSEGPIGPCIQVKPGQTMTIQVTNRLQKGMKNLNQYGETPKKYWDLTQIPGLPDLDDLDWNLTDIAQKVEDMVIDSRENLPGWDNITYDDVNLHFHGLVITPHLFHPLGTNSTEADWITIRPEHEDPSKQQYCYVIKVHEHHVQGTFWWHIHRHGADAMQGWQGMVGLLKVGNHKSEINPEYALAAQGVHRDETFLMWEWEVQEDNQIADGAYYEGNFIQQTIDGLTLMLVNNQYQPTFTMDVSETMRLRLCNAQTTTGSMFYILDPNDQFITFSTFATDGIAFDRAYAKNITLFGPGQREDILLQFKLPGTYRVMQGVLADFNEDNAFIGPVPDSEDVPMAFFEVTDNGANAEPVDISSIALTPGRSMSPPSTQGRGESHDIKIQFTVGNSLRKLPIPQFSVDGVGFDHTDIKTVVEPYSQAVWTLESPLNYYHPFHIHVNPFQVKSVTTALPDGPLREATLNSNLVPPNMWRDTVYVAPFGTTTIWQQFNQSDVAWQGKTVFHCHFLDHEDQGMMSAFTIQDKALTPPQHTQEFLV
jgi:FtsP/CotA-like multicopper oxidase with cupredoxin domain